MALQSADVWSSFTSGATDSLRRKREQTVRTGGRKLDGAERRSDSGCQNILNGAMKPMAYNNSDNSQATTEDRAMLQTAFCGGGGVCQQ